MVDLNSELRSTLLDSGVTISDQLADEIISWGIRYIEDNVGIPLEGRQEITEEEQAKIEPASFTRALIGQSEATCHRHCS
jgi:hypothetical protein